MNSFNGLRAFDFVNKINFQRVAGTDGERKAAEIIQAELQSLGLAVEWQEFDISTSHGSRSVFRVLQPYEKTIEIAYRAISGSLPEGVTAGFKYIESGGERYCHGIENCVVMTTGRIDRVLYQRLKRHNVVAILVPVNYNAELYRVGFDVDFVKKFGNLPICFIGYQDALEMVKKGAERVFLKIEDSIQMEGKGINIISEIRGSIKPDEVFCFIGHYDSVMSNGIYDNAAGTAMVLEMAHHYAIHQPARTVRFILFSGEELGLRGSKAYIEKLKENPAELKRVKMVFNFDLAGTILGRNGLRITADAEVFHYFNAKNILEDWDFLVEHDIYSSDNMPFGREGIPALNFYRTSMGIGHGWNDTIDHVAAEYFNVMGEFAVKVTSELVNAPVLPFKRQIGEEMRKKILDYFDRASAEEPDASS